MNQNQVVEFANNFAIQNTMSRIALIVLLVIIIVVIILIVKYAGKNNTPQNEEEKVNDAYRTINEGAPEIPGLGSVTPIKAPKEKVELDEKEIPWELKDENQDDDNT